MSNRITEEPDREERGWYSKERKRPTTMKQKSMDALAELVAAASTKVLTDLTLKLAAERPDVQRDCFDFLKTHVSLSEVMKKRSEGEIVMALWIELEPDLQELDDYGGGAYDCEDHVSELLDEVQIQLNSNKIGPEFRCEILERVLPFIESGNAGMDDLLYEVAYATCYDDADWRRLAVALEAMQGDWKLDHARRIYRRLRDRDKYLELRADRMEYGGDYYDLATFYWETGEKEKALQVAEEGLREGQGRMDELREFVAERAEAAGDREKYLQIQFEQATDRLTLEKYKAFKEMCKQAEWVRYEPRVLARIEATWETEQLKVRMYRKEFDKAVNILTELRYPATDWNGDYEIQAAKKLEKRYPEEILKYYVSGLGNLRINATRKEYARKAKVMVKVHCVLDEVLGDKARWKKFAAKVKQENIRRPAFQQEFGKVVTDWKELI